ncbi:hypothetical protein MANES_18G136304v8 [Manihot esculenta]|uniref:Uncharacterized protein n=2 Tax=Manihot esculenta TaxID=3983 RepID=A0ACB7G142_MANES|nr:hypothetical protein MANES_18G136304v8 [Manihot esculenta]
MIGLYHLTSSLSQVPIPLPHTGSHLPTSLSLKPQSQLKHADGSESLLTFLVPSPFSSFSPAATATHPPSRQSRSHPPTDSPTRESQPESFSPSFASSVPQPRPSTHPVGYSLSHCRFSEDEQALYIVIDCRFIFGSVIWRGENY